MSLLEVGGLNLYPIFRVASSQNRERTGVPMRAPRLGWWMRPDRRLKLSGNIPSLPLRVLYHCFGSVFRMFNFVNAPTASLRNNFAGGPKMRTLRSWSKFLTIGAVLLPATTIRAQDWPQWRGPNRDGNAPALASAWPKDLKEEWKVTVGIGHSSPVVANGRIYVFARQGEEEVLLCLDAVTGKELWRANQAIAYQLHPAATGHGKGPKSTPV